MALSPSPPYAMGVLVVALAVKSRPHQQVGLPAEPGQGAGGGLLPLLVGPPGLGLGGPLGLAALHLGGGPLGLRARADVQAGRLAVDPLGAVVVAALAAPGPGHAPPPRRHAVQRRADCTRALPGGARPGL